MDIPFQATSFPPECLTRLTFLQKQRVLCVIGPFVVTFENDVNEASSDDDDDATSTSSSLSSSSMSSGDEDADSTFDDEGDAAALGDQEERPVQRRRVAPPFRELTVRYMTRVIDRSIRSVCGIKRHSAKCLSMGISKCSQSAVSDI